MNLYTKFDYKYILIKFHYSGPFLDIVLKEKNNKARLVLWADSETKFRRAVLTLRREVVATCDFCMSGLTAVQVPTLG